MGATAGWPHANALTPPHPTCGRMMPRSPPAPALRSVGKAAPDVPCGFFPGRSRMTIAQQPIHAASANGAQTQLSVLNPMGYPPRVTGKALAPRLDSLDGKTVFLVDCRFDDSA